MSTETTGGGTVGLNSLLAECSTMKERLKEIERIANDAAALREKAGCYDEEILEECLALLEYATWHDGRYGQVGNYDSFQDPAQKLVKRVAARLGKESYARFKG